MKMRNEQEMMDVILGFAKNDDCIRVVTMEGSKLNKNVPVDKFQDFDIAFIVKGATSHNTGLHAFGSCFRSNCKSR
jgi:aminoglycoside 6-adenylyltransferase